jgi:hypothetical protein
LPVKFGGGQLVLSDYILSFINPGSTRDGGYIVNCIDNVWIPVVGIIGMALLSGMLISVFINILQNRKDKVDNGKAHYRFSNHVLIIGYDRMAVSLIKQITKKYSDRKKYGKVEIVLQTTQNVPGVHNELFALLDRETEQNITFILGSRTSAEDLEKLRPEHCREIFILGESDEQDHDSLNIKCMELIRDILRFETNENPRHIKPCHVLFEYQSTYAVFQQQDVPDIKDYLDFLPFNFCECWAQKVLVENKHTIEEKGKEPQIITYQSLDRGDGIKYNSTKHVHLVVIGMSQMGVAMGIQAAHICHFPNFITKGIKTIITFIDEHADREMNFLKGRFRHLFSEVDYSFCDINTGETKDYFDPNHFTDLTFEFIKGRVESDEIQNKLKYWATAADELFTIAVCFSSSPVAIAAGLYLPDEIYEKDIPVFVRQKTSACTLSLLSQNIDKEQYRKYKNVKPFGMLDYAYDIEKADSLLPKMVKYAYGHVKEIKEEKGKRYVYARSEAEPVEKFEEITEIEIENDWKNWAADANIIALKFSNIHCANMIGIKGRSLNIKPDDTLSNEQINLLARIEHNRWNIEKLLMGYRACTDVERKEIEDSKESKSDEEKHDKPYFRKRYIHEDIKPFDTLNKDDKGIQVQVYDIGISKAFPVMLKKYEQIKSAQQ